MTSQWHILKIFLKQRSIFCMGISQRKYIFTSAAIQWRLCQPLRKNCNCGVRSVGKRRKRGSVCSTKAKNTLTPQGEAKSHPVNLSSGSWLLSVLHSCTGPFSHWLCLCYYTCTALYGGILWPWLLFSLCNTNCLVDLNWWNLHAIIFLVNRIYTTTQEIKMPGVLWGMGKELSLCVLFRCTPDFTDWEEILHETH